MASQDDIDESVSGGSSKATVTISGSIKDWVAAVSVVVNVVLGMALFMEYRAQAQAKDLADYNLTFHINHEFAELKSDVEVTKQLVAAKCSK